MWNKIIVVSLLVYWGTIAASAQASYTVTDLGTLSPTAINSWAQVVGNYNNQAYLWSFGHRLALGKLTGGTFSSAAAINDFGVIAGTADGAGTVLSPYSGIPNQQCSDLVQPFVWQDGSIRGLGAVGFQTIIDWCGYPFYATGINLSGQVVGYTSQYPNEYQWGFLWTNGASQNLPVTFFLSAGDIGLFADGWPPTFPSAITSLEQVVGQDGLDFGMGHATSWQNGTATDLGPPDATSLPNFYASSANGVNDLGQIVGWASTTPAGFLSGVCYFDLSTTDCPINAVIWSASGVMTDLGTLPGDSVSMALKINLFGQVIGSSGNTIVSVQPEGNPAIEFVGPLQVTGHPFIWTESSGMQDLNTLIRANSGWVLNSVADINVWGQIVGSGTLNGKQHGFLLTPRDPFSRSK
jgi:probable HAF family extracellular repeat protein